VNYFGHAVVVTRLIEAPAPAIALGAMLPDFLSMCGARPIRVDDPLIERGIALHHETDAAFHTLAPFTGLVRELGDRLTHAGVSRGPMRGVAHVAVELFLDGTMIDDPRAAAAYEAAIALEPALVFPSDEAPRFAYLQARLRTHGVPRDLARAESVAARCLRMLAHRPLLAPKGSEPQLIERVLGDFAHRCAVAAPTIMHALRASMESAATPGAPWHRENRSGSSRA